MRLFAFLMKYKTIVADPPWRYKSTNPVCLPEKQPLTCSVEYYYPTMSIAEIKDLKVSEVADQNSVLFLWATSPMLPEAFDVMKSWGWKYKTIITWHKTNKDCMGYWFRVCTEHILVGTRGKVKSFRSMQRNLIESPRGKHSEKPEFAYQLIEQVSPGPYLEMFARHPRQGWSVWGDEVESHVILSVSS